MVGTETLAGRYRIERKVAVGGMGTVFAAIDERLDRRVALKVLKEELAADTAFVERFRREARAAAALSHPNIANVFDYGRDNGVHFIAMELVEGRDLARALREDGPLLAERAAEIATQTCRALAHAHAAGVVHRDVKPANIILSDDDRVKVTDFGIARAAGDVTLTATGAVLGTAHYLSPEQAQGSPIGPASDIYSLGIVLYEMLTGSVPFTGDSLVAVAMRHVSDEVPPPSELNADVPPELDAIVARACAKEPRARFTSAEDMAAALAPVTGAATEPLAAPTATAVLAQGAQTFPGEAPPLPIGRWNPRRVGAIALITLGALALVAAALLFWRVASDDEPARRQRGGAAPAPATSAAPIGTAIPATVIGLPVNDAEEILKDLGFEKIGKFETDPADFEGFEDAPAGTVIAVDPPPGTMVLPVEPITLVVSKPQEDDDGPGNSGKGHGRGHEKKEDD